MAVAITAAITTLAEAEQRFQLTRTEEDSFFVEWSTDLPSLSDTEKAGLVDLRRRYLYQRAQGLYGILQILKRMGQAIQ